MNRDELMNIFKSLKSKQGHALLLLCLLSLLFVYGCQCEGEIGTKANKTVGAGVTAVTLDKK